MFESIVCSTDDCPAIDNRLVSEPLTVWRTLHIEYDQMSNPTWEDNMIIRGYFSDFVSYSGSTSIKQVETISGIRAPKPASAGGAWIWDETKPLIDGSGAYPKGTGRFNDGGVHVGNPPTVICDKGGCIKYNTVDAVTFYGPTDLTLGGLTAVLSAPGGSSPPLPILDIEKLTGQDFKVTVDLGASGVNLADYEGRGVNISDAGPCTACVQTISGAPAQFILKNSAGKSNLKIPIVLTDDDNIPYGGVSTLIQPPTFDVTKNAFADVYIDVTNDGGGVLSNNQSAIPFVRNVNPPKGSLDEPEVYSLEPLSVYYNTFRYSKIYEAQNYWCCYVVSGWQYVTRFDNDPEKEDYVPLGQTNSFTEDCILIKGGNMTIIYHESITDVSFTVSYLEGVVAHEIGHQFGLSHGDKKGMCASCVVFNCKDGRMGLMSKSPPFFPGEYFIGYHKNLLRSRYNSPGQ
ncbi:MAG: hypothetical protein IT260_12420 [Saprospiraceae bacterium]|nr:hypothetical protein [Saprospiraceae bacterium]